MGIENDSPNNNIDRFKCVSMLPEDEQGWATVRPSNDTDIDWGKVALGTREYEKHCATDANANDGLDFIARFNK